MIDTEKLELRRTTCEALGFKVLSRTTYNSKCRIAYRIAYALIEPGPDGYIITKSTGQFGWGWHSEESSVWMYCAPALESNNGLALDAAQAFGKSEGLVLRLGVFPNGNTIASFENQA